GSCLSSTASSWHASLVQLSDDGVADFLQFLQLMFKLLLFSQLVVLQQANGFVAPLNDFLLVLFTDFCFHVFIFNAVFHIKGVRLQRVLGCNLLSLEIVLCFVLICFLHHPLNLLLAQPALVI
ncbi:hypothetical protein C0J45_12501, partial [Silurus meridionalis]